MQIVIEIPEEIYNQVKHESGEIFISDIPAIKKGIKTGTLLPKGHGRLIDVEKIGFGDIECVICAGYLKDAIMMLENRLKDAPTIIEADKAESEDKG